MARTGDAPIIPPMLRLSLICLLLAAPLCAQELAIDVDAGIGGMVATPATEIRIRITKNDRRPFVGRVIIDMGQPDFTGGGGPRARRGMGFMADVKISQDINLEEGALQRTIRMEVPVGSIALSAHVLLERQVSGTYYETVTETDLHLPVRNSGTKLVGFVSEARLAMARPYVFFELVEIAVEELPESWKPLAGFDAIILNDDRITRAQSNALIDYMSMGGTVLLSPRGNASFNPETPAGSLLKIPPTIRPRTVTMKDFDALLKKPRLGGVAPAINGTTMPAPPGEIRPDGEQPAERTELVELVESKPGDAFTLWPHAGRAHPVPDALGLVSNAPVGAGNLVLIHVNLSDYPFSQGKLSYAAVNLMLLAMQGVDDRLGRSPYRALAAENVRNSIDIAGRRIPGREAMVLLLLLYVTVAGVGMFLLARRVRRPELYPAALLAAALLSVGLVFTFGEIFKRSGDRVKTARILISDDTTGRSAVFTLGCSYAVGGDKLLFQQSRDSLFAPTNFETRLGRPGAMPDQPQDFSAHFTATEIHTEVTGLDRWQNVFFMHRQPSAPPEMKLHVEALQGAWKVTNLSPHKLQGVIFIVGRPASGVGSQRGAWHYQSSLSPTGEQDDAVTFSQSTEMDGSAYKLDEDLKRDVSDGDAFDVLAQLMNIHPDDRILRHTTLAQVEGILWESGVLPVEGQYVMICVLPPGAISPSSIGAQEVDESDVGQVNLWIVRGVLNTR